MPTFNGHVTGNNVAVSELMGGGFLAKRITGPVSFDSDLTSSGYSMADLVGGLQGNGKVDGSITVLCQVEQQVGSALLGILGQQVKQLQGFTESVNAVYSAFTGSPNALNGTFDINQGVLNTQDLSLTNNRARLLATGDANIAAWTMDMIANIFSQEYPDQPYLSIDLDGPMDGPNTKFSGNAFARGSDELQGAFGNQSPTDIFNGIIPGLPGSEGGSESGGGSAFPASTASSRVSAAAMPACRVRRNAWHRRDRDGEPSRCARREQQNEASPEGAAPDVASPDEERPVKPRRRTTRRGRRAGDRAGACGTALGRARGSHAGGRATGGRTGGEGTRAGAAGETGDAQ